MQRNATFSVVISTKNRWRTPKLRTDSSLKFPCCLLETKEQDVTSSRLMNHVNPFICNVCFTTSTENSNILFVHPAMLKNRTILSLAQRIEVLCRLGEQCSKPQMARMVSKQTRKVTMAYVEYKHSRTVGLQYLSCYVALILGLLL